METSPLGFRKYRYYNNYEGKNKTLISVVAAQLIFVFVSACTGFLMTRLISYEIKANL